MVCSQSGSFCPCLCLFAASLCKPPFPWSCLQQRCKHLRLYNQVPFVQVADADIKKAGFVTKWLGYGAQSLGPVKRKDGTTVERVVETWLPKKKVKAYSLR